MIAKTVSVDSIVEGNRAREDYGDLSTLKESMANKDIGQIQSLAVIEVENSYILLAGGRRWRAIQELVEEGTHDGQVLIRIYPDSLDSRTRLSIELAENLNRLNLDWKEEAKLTKRIHELNKEVHNAEDKKLPDGRADLWNPGKTAELLGKHRSTIVTDIDLATALEIVPELEKCKSKDEARKVMGNVLEKAITDEMAARVEEIVAETPLEKIREAIAKRYILDDAFDGMKRIPGASYDMIELDPPYASEFETLESHSKSQSSILEIIKMQGFHLMDVETYPVALSIMIEEAYRLLKPGGWLLMWYAQDPWANEVYECIIRNGFKTKRIPAVWNKSLGDRDMRYTASPDNYLGRMHETFYYARKGEARIINRARGDVFNYRAPHPNERIHPTEKPVDLLADIYSTFTTSGSRLLIPFLGSGNGLLAASKLGIDSQGFELSEEYRKKFIVHLQQWSPADD